MCNENVHVYNEESIGKRKSVPIDMKGRLEMFHVAKQTMNNGFM